ANTETDLTQQLHPMPVDPGEHIIAAHAYARLYLERLPQHDPTRLIVADEEHSYTPRKILRRILDHALDHLNQIEQWLTWQRHGIVPAPTDGWATSGETLPEDLHALSPAELQAWLWRIDLTLELVAERARQLSATQLDWVPPAGGWTLSQTLHHLASAEIYYAIWLDEALPDEPIARYSEANRRFVQQLRQVFVMPEAKTFLNPDEQYTPVTAEQITHMLLTEERVEG
ncbi:MAG: DinB family protein, partial [Ktedonobacteraceae bacterium]